MSLKVAILGSGIVGKTLDEGFKKHGYETKLGSRGEFSKLASWGQVIVLAVKGTAAESALELAGSQNLKGKTIIDATNPIADEAPENGVLKFFTQMNHSLMERLQSKFPMANFVKAFNSVGNVFMVNPDFGKNKPTMFICGNNQNAKSQVAEILNQFGWEIEDMGEATAARAIEPLCILWCIPGLKNNQWSHAFKLLKK